ncbi:MAG: ABC transporter substrate-binding protein [Peptococcaceae bacterium]|jgi:NitT/TauT family transport system substrate-binding protein|nr:ABC transporter substrate-binding protein [Peptococcaceae bacterium]MBQ2034844.1 ABC transporter substrate-binding protein [Peptococcaceae bacterium]
MKKQWKKIFASALMGAVLLTGCGGGEAKEEQNADAMEPVTVGLMRIDDSFPFYVAEKEGLFEKHGVTVELQNFSSARDLSTALQGGELDALMTDPVVTALSLKGGTDVRIVAMALGAVPEEGRFLVISAPDSGITAPEQLEGRNIAISNNTMMDYLVEQYENNLGLDKAAITTVNMPDLMLRTTTLLEGTEIDAAILPDPLAAYAVAEGANIVIDDTKLGENFSQSVVTATSDAIENNRAGMEAMLAAYNEAIELINANPDAYRAFALECANVPPALADSYPTPTFTANSIPDEANIAQVNSWMVERGLLEKAYEYNEMVDTSFID